MFPVSEANFFREKNTVFSSHSGHKTAAAFVSVFGWAALVAAGGMRARHYDANCGGGGIGGGGQVEGLGGGQKGKRNGWHRDDHW